MIKQLPTIRGEGIYIDPFRVQCAFIFVRNSVRLIHCICDGDSNYLYCSLSLKQWFLDSGIILLDLNHRPDVRDFVSVNNVPEKYIEPKKR